MNDRIVIARLTARLDALEAQCAVRIVMADYMRLCDRLDVSTPMEALGNLFTADAVWTGVGARYEQTFGTHHGRSAILDMLDRYRTPPHFALNAHFLASEKIAVVGATAQGSWMMLQTSTYSDGLSDLRSALLTVNFRLDGSNWRISRFATNNLFSRRVDRWQDDVPVPMPQGA